MAPATALEQGLQVAQTPLEEFLSDHKGRLAACQLVKCLGAWVYWWARQRVLQHLQKRFGGHWERPSLGPLAGGCIVWFEQQPRDRWPLLLPALPLPVVWSRQPPEPAKRPPLPLLRLAQQVAHQLGHPDWHLQTLLPVPGGNWSALEDQLKAASGWAPLAAALWVAAQGGRSDLRVGATGAWIPKRGLQPVLLEGKLQAAAELGIRQFFVPECQLPQAQRACEGVHPAPDVQPLPTGTTDWRETLHPLLAQMDYPPDEHASPEVQAQWYVRQPDLQKARHYYHRMLLSPIADRLRKQWEAQVGQSCSQLVTIISHNPELAVLTTLMTGAQRVVVLFTRDQAPNLNVFKRLLRQANSQVEIGTREFATAEELAQQAGPVVGELADQLPPEHLAVDLTPGTKEMTLAMFAAARAGNRLVYLRHRIQQRRAVPFSERLRVFDRGQG